MTLAQSAQLKRGAIAGAAIVVMFGSIGLLTGSFAAWSVTLAGGLMIAMSILFSWLEGRSTK